MERIKLSKLTLFVAAYLIISAVFASQAWKYLIHIFGKSNVEAVSILLLAVIAGAVLIFLIWSSIGITRIVICVGGLIIAAKFAWMQPFFVKKIHVLEYGLLGWLASRDMLKTKISFKSIFLALLFVSLVGGLDELLQKFLPYRFGQLGDFLTNVFSGSLGIILFLAGRKL